MYDLAPPTGRYAEEGATLRNLSRQEDSKYIAADRSSDRAKRLTASVHRQRRDKFNSYANLLSEELKDQSASRLFTIKRLTREKLHWFSHGECKSGLDGLSIESACSNREICPAGDVHY
jgi:THO complex subunit 2